MIRPTWSIASAASTSRQLSTSSHILPPKESALRGAQVVSRPGQLDPAPNGQLKSPRLPPSRRRVEPVKRIDRRSVPALDEAISRKRVPYRTDVAVVSNERRNFFSNDLETEGVELNMGLAQGAEPVSGLEPGLVVEIRRSGASQVGLILASILIAGRSRLLFLRSNGEVWPISANDVQFAFPPSLVPPGLASRCWSPDLLEAWWRGQEAIESEDPSGKARNEALFAARREVVMILRKVMKEVERSLQKLSSSAGIEAVYDVVAPEDEEIRGSVTAAQAAAYLRRAGAIPDATSETEPRAEPDALVVFAAHKMMMQRSDLFLSGQGDMWATGTFLVRSRAERRRLMDVTRWVEGKTPEDRAVLESFLTKTRRLVEKRDRLDTSQPTTASRATDQPFKWSPQDLAIIHILFLRLYEVRSTQATPTGPLVITILRILDVYPGETIDEGLVVRFLTEIGMLTRTDSLEASKFQESERRRTAVAGPQMQSDPEQGLLNGTEMDDLREDFSGQRVFVIDEATATELDDGVSIERVGDGTFWVHVHVADPTSYLPPSHKVAVQASFRGTAAYIPEGHIPLLPIPETMKKLSIGAESTRNEGAQGVLTVSSKISKTGAVLDGKIALGWIKRPRVVTYGLVDEVLGVERSKPVRPFGTPLSYLQLPAVGREPMSLNEADRSDLTLLRDLAKKHRARRFANAGLDFGLPTGSSTILDSRSSLPNLFEYTTLANLAHPDPSVDFAGAHGGALAALSSPTILYTIPRSPSQEMTSMGLIAELMILAGRTAARWCIERSIPVPFRSSDPPKEVSAPGQRTLTIDELMALRSPDGYIDPFDVLKSGIYLPPTTLSHEPKQHWAMGSVSAAEPYLRITSPLRRYDDLLVHWQVKAWLAGEHALRASASSTLDASGSARPKLMNTEEMMRLALRSEVAQKRARYGGKSAQSFWLAGLVQSRLHGPVPAGWDIDSDKADILAKPILARVSSLTYAVPGVNEIKTEVYIPGLGTTATMRGPATKRYDVGEWVMVRVIKGQQWPSAEIQVVGE